MSLLTEKQITEFNQQGYVVVDNILDFNNDLQPIMEEYYGVLDRLAHELYSQGKISSLYSELPFNKRLIEVYLEAGKVYSQYFTISLPPDGVKEDTPFWAGEAVFKVLRNESLLDAVESLIGSEIYATPILHGRIKPPEHLTPTDASGNVQLGKTAIHQDNAGLLPEADDTDMLIVWFPMHDATVKNGCLCVWPGSHRHGLLPHRLIPGRAYIPAETLKNSGKATAIPVKQGSVLFMHKLLIHASYANNSDDIRWSIDLRYNPTDQPRVRSYFPGFIARSRAHPETECFDPAQWHRHWHEARQQLAVQGFTPKFHRWIEEASECANEASETTHD
jgi:ectoine hydroxylase-related dioxygenase (phytanoyl-CoA dioxygenase family)